MGAAPARKAFVDVINAISQFEPVTVIADPTVVRCWGSGVGWGLVAAAAAAAAAVVWIDPRLQCAAAAAPDNHARSTPPTHNHTRCRQWADARASLPDHVRVVETCHDDSWLRDSGPTVVLGEITNCPQPAIRCVVRGFAAVL